MSEREKIFARIAEALQEPSQPAAAAHPHRNVPPPSPAHARQWLPAVESSPNAQMAAFARNAVELKASFEQVKGTAGAQALLTRLRDEAGWKRIATHRGNLSDAVTGGLGLPVLLTDSGYEPAELEKCDAGITQCDALVAQTGSVLLTNLSAGGRALSALPPHHVVLATADQLVGDLPEAFALLRTRYEGRYPSFISFVTGPSRTGDIERILVLGAHGPKKLTIIMIGQNS